MSEAIGVAVENAAFGMDAIDEAGVPRDDPVEGNPALNVGEELLSFGISYNSDFKWSAVADAADGIEDFVVMGAVLGSGLCEISDGVHTDGVAVVLEDAGEGGGGTIAFVSLGDHGDGVNEVVPIWVGGYGIAGALVECF